MTAAELRAILAHVPDDMPVLAAGRGTGHINLVSREPSMVVPRRVEPTRHCETGRCALPEYEDVRVPGHLVLWSSGYRPPGLADPTPGFRLRGAFLRRKALDAELDALDPMPAPEGDPA